MLRRKEVSVTKVCRTGRYSHKRGNGKGLHKGNVTEYDSACSDVNGEQGERSWEGLGSSVLDGLPVVIHQREGGCFFGSLNS